MKTTLYRLCLSELLFEGTLLVENIISRIKL